MAFQNILEDLFLQFPIKIPIFEGSFLFNECGLSCHVERDFLKSHSRRFVLCINADKDVMPTRAVDVIEGDLSSFLIYTQDLGKRFYTQHMGKDLVMGVPSPCCHRQSSTDDLLAAGSQLSLFLVSLLVSLLQLSLVVA